MVYEIEVLEVIRNLHVVKVEADSLEEAVERVEEGEWDSGVLYDTHIETL